MINLFDTEVPRVRFLCGNATAVAGGQETRCKNPACKGNNPPVHAGYCARCTAVSLVKKCGIKPIRLTAAAVSEPELATN